MSGDGTFAVNQAVACIKRLREHLSARSAQYMEAVQENAYLVKQNDDIFGCLSAALQYHYEGEAFDEGNEIDRETRHELAARLAAACIKRLNDARHQQARIIADLKAENGSLKERAALNDGSAWRAEVARMGELIGTLEGKLEGERSLRSKAQTIIQYITGMMGEIDLEGVKTIFDLFQQASGGEYSYSFDELVGKLREFLKLNGCVDTHSGYGRGEMVVKRERLHYYSGNVTTALKFSDGHTMTLTGARVSEPEIAPRRDEPVNKYVGKVTLSEADITYSCGCVVTYLKGDSVKPVCPLPLHDEEGAAERGTPTKGTYR